MDHHCPSNVWLQIADGILAGINHAISNRLANLGAHVELLRMGGEGAGEALHGISAENEKLEEILRLSRLLPRERQPEPEPLDIPEMLPDIIALLHLHRDLREVECTVTGDPDILPVRVERSALLRTVLAMLVATGMRSDPSRTIALGYAGDGAYSLVSVEGEATAELEVPDPLKMRELIQRAGGSLAEVRESGKARYELRLPTLAELRRRSRG